MPKGFIQGQWNSIQFTIVPKGQILNTFDEFTVPLSKTINWHKLKAKKLYKIINK